MAEWLRLTFSDQSQTTLQEIGQFVNLRFRFTSTLLGATKFIKPLVPAGSSFRKTMVSKLLNFTGFGATRPKCLRTLPRPNKGSATAWSNGFRCFPKLPLMSTNRFLVSRKPSASWLVDRKTHGVLEIPRTSGAKRLHSMFVILTYKTSYNFIETNYFAD